MALTKKIAGNRTSNTNVRSGKDARNFFMKLDVHFPDGMEFQITGYNIVQFAKPGETEPAPDARRHIEFTTNKGDGHELLLQALWTPKYELDQNNPSAPPKQIYPDGSLTKKLDELINASNDDIETFIKKNIEMLKQLKLKVRRRRFYGLDNFGRKSWMSQLNVDIIELTLWDKRFVRIES